MDMFVKNLVSGCCLGFAYFLPDVVYNSVAHKKQCSFSFLPFTIIQLLNSVTLFHGVSSVSYLITWLSEICLTSLIALF